MGAWDQFMLRCAGRHLGPNMNESTISRRSSSASSGNWNHNGVMMGRRSEVGRVGGKREHVALERRPQPDRLGDAHFGLGSKAPRLVGRASTVCAVQRAHRAELVPAGRELQPASHHGDDHAPAWSTTARSINEHLLQVHAQGGPYTIKCLIDERLTSGVVKPAKPPTSELQKGMPDKPDDSPTMTCERNSFHEHAMSLDHLQARNTVPGHAHTHVSNGGNPDCPPLQALPSTIDTLTRPHRALLPQPRRCATE